MLFTIITCTYNAESVIQRTLDSVARQGYDGVQHIIMDGASTDATVQIASQYQSDSLRHKVIVVSEKDSGLYDAMNKAMQLATGQYLVFLNAGDTLRSDDTLELMAEKIAGKEYGVVYGDTDIVDSDGRFIAPRRLRPPEKLSWKSFANGMLVCHQSFYANTAIAKRTAYNLQYKLSADVDWCIRVMKEAERQQLPMLNTEMTLCNYLEGGMSIKNHRASLLERFKLMADHYGLLTTIYKHLTFLFRK